MNDKHAGQGAPMEASALKIMAAGMLALATAMGIGRFAFTPLLPMMLSDGVIDLAGASWLASANYLGYLVGALLCTFQPLIWRRFSGLPEVLPSTWVRLGLTGTCALTMGMALQVPALWPLLRFLAGVASALVFVFSSSWVLGELAKRSVGTLGAVMYAGPGVGICVSGLAASGMVALHWSAASGWLLFGVLSSGLSAMVWQTFHSSREKVTQETVAVSSGVVQQSVPAPSGVSQASKRQMVVLALAYGLAGFGYIISATFLPVIARQSLPPSFMLDMFWPVFGLGVVTGALFVSRTRTTVDLRYWLAACYFLQALAIGIGILSPTLAGFALGSFLLGVPFTALTFFALQEVRRLRAESAARYIGLLTACYGAGQVAGPPMVAAILPRAASVGAGFTLSLEIAAGSLLLGAAVYLLMSKVWPVVRR